MYLGQTCMTTAYTRIWILMETHYHMTLANVTSAVMDHCFSSVSLDSQADRVNLRLYK